MIFVDLIQKTFYLGSKYSISNRAYKFSLSLKSKLVTYFSKRLVMSHK